MPVDAIELWEHPLLQGVERTQIASALGSLRPRRLRRGEILATAASTPAVHLILAGLVHASVSSRTGGRVLLELVGPGGMDGYLSLTGRRVHTSEAAADPTVVVSLTRARWNQLIRAHPQIAINASELMMQRLARREQQLATLAFRDALHRIASELLMLAGAVAYSSSTDGESPLPFRITHRDLAEMLGITRETVTTNLRTLRDAGAVRTAHGHLVAVDAGRLGDILDRDTA